MSGAPRVVLFKSQAPEYEQAFRECGLEPVFVEALTFAELNEDLLRERLKDNWDAVAVTSPRAAALVARCGGTTAPVWAVGGATARALGPAGATARGTDSGSSAALASQLATELTEGAALLFPCGARAAEALPAMLTAQGVRVEVLPVYEATEAPRLGDELTACAAGASALVFFSAAGCEYVHRRLQTCAPALLQLPHFAVGDATALRVCTLGLDVAGVAARPTAADMAAVVGDYFQQQSKETEVAE